MLEHLDFEHLIMQVIAAIGDDPHREGLKDTPARVVRSWNELFKGYNQDNRPALTVFDNNTDGIKYDEMILDSGPFNSFCEHHMLPFRGTYHFGYIPDQYVIGLSKVARVVDYYSSRLQIQERLTKQIVDELQEVLKPKAIGIVLQASHECKELRGVHKPGMMTTSDLRGLFRTEPETRAEFLQFTSNY